MERTFERLSPTRGVACFVHCASVRAAARIAQSRTPQARGGSSSARVSNAPRAGNRYSRPANVVHLLREPARATVRAQRGTRTRIWRAHRVRVTSVSRSAGCNVIERIREIDVAEPRSNRTRPNEGLRGENT